MKRLPLLMVIVFYFGLYTFQLEHYPLFIDEATHLMWARDTLDLHPFGSFREGKILLGSLYAVFWPYANAAFVGRMVSVFIGGVGLASLMALARRTLPPQVAVAAGLLYTLIPYRFFFGRMILADPVGDSFIWLAAWAGVVTLTTKRPLPGLVCGAAVGLAALTRHSNIVYLSLPLVVWVFFQRETSRRMAVTLATIYGAAVVVALPYMLLALAGGGLGMEHVTDVFLGSPGGSPFSRLWPNLRTAAGWMAAYTQVPMLLTAAVGVIVALRRRWWQAAFFVAIPLIVILEFLLLTFRNFPRNYLPVSGAVAVLAAVCLWGVSQWLFKRGWPSVVLALLLSIPAVGFITTYFAGPPTAMPLPPKDYGNYITEEVSGYAVRDAAGWLAAYAQTQQRVTVICGANLTCDWLDLFAYQLDNVDYALTDRATAAFVSAEAEAGHVVLLVDDIPTAFGSSAETVSLPRTRLATFDRPGGVTSFYIDQLLP